MSLNRVVVAAVVLAVGMLVVAPSAQADCAPSGGGCNQYGCWRTPYGSCNQYGCRDVGGCNQYGCWNTPYGGCNQYGCWR